MSAEAEAQKELTRFRILHVEDEQDFAKDIKSAVDYHNARGWGRQLHYKWIRSPDLLKAELNEDYDLILADVYFDEPSKKGRKTNGSRERDRLGEVISITTAWTKQAKASSRVPIIAYTRRGRSALDECLKHRLELYDIWDKAIASPDYAAWQLSRIAWEMTRLRPGALLSRLVRRMPTGAPWHRRVQKMAREYANCWTESDQIKMAGHEVVQVAWELGTNHHCKPLWELMEQWEPLSRAVSERVRGHARHVINVYWLGYYLIHQRHLSGLFAKVWEARFSRAGFKAGTDRLDTLSACWFYAGLFHDIANCVQEENEVQERLAQIFGRFGPIYKKKGTPFVLADDLAAEGVKIIRSLPKAAQAPFLRAWHKSVEEGHPDHGIVAAVRIAQGIGNKHLPHFKEAGRAMAVHNLAGKLGGKLNEIFTWEEEPLICLLLFCDQLQTWDRERGTSSHFDKQNAPERAELTELFATNAKGKPTLTMKIDYIAPEHVVESPEVFRSVKAGLEAILRDYPDAALSAIRRPWMFGHDLTCYLNGEGLDLATGKSET